MTILHPPRYGVALLRLGFDSPSTPSLAQRGGLVTRALDLLREGVAFFDLNEQPVHANAVLHRILTEQPDAEEIRREIRRFTESLGALVRRHVHNDEGMLAELAVRGFRTFEGSCLPRGSYVRMDDGGEGMLLVALEPAGAEFLSVELLQSRYVGEGATTRCRIAPLRRRSEAGAGGGAPRGSHPAPFVFW